MLATSKRLKYDGIDTRYIVYDDGSVFDELNKVFIKPYCNPHGYQYVHLWIIKGKDTREAVHRLVAKMFIPNPENKPQVNHKDGNKQNNHVSNLEWVTPSENNRHAYQNGLHKPIQGEGVHFSKYKSEQVELACSEMEKRQLTMYEIESLTGIPVKTLYDIRQGHIWKSISSKYNLSGDNVVPSKYLTYAQKHDVIELLDKGLSPREICTELGLEQSEKIRSCIRDIRWNRDPSKKHWRLREYRRSRDKVIFDRINKAQRSLKPGEDDYEDIIINHMASE